MIDTFVLNALMPIICGIVIVVGLVTIGVYKYLKARNERGEISGKLLDELTRRD